MEKIFNKKDLKLIENKGISLKKIEQQFYFFTKGISKIKLEKSATIDDGILVFSDKERDELCLYFDEIKINKSIQKFVPASGAASRMFKFLSEFLSDYNFEKESINSYINKHKNHDLSIFLVGLKDFPFYQKVKSRVIETHPNYYNLKKDKKDYYFIKALLSSDEFDFANKPKGVLPFHYKNNTIISPVEEHIFESVF
jgi:coproporphyrinogen III oxidase-like Fe-S oxidoreductase